MFRKSDWFIGSTLLLSAPSAFAQTHTAYPHDHRDTVAEPTAFRLTDLSGRDWSRLRSTATADGLVPATGRVSPTIGNPNPWASSIDGDDFFEGFEGPSYSTHVSLNSITDWVALAGQTASNSEAWKTVSSVGIAMPSYVGVVDNSIAQTGPDWNPLGAGFQKQGVGGGPDPLGLRSQFYADPRGTVFSLTPEASITDFKVAACLDHAFYVPKVASPVVTVFDVYIDKLDTMTWFRPVSRAEDTIVTNIFLGGMNFGTFSAFTNAQDRLDRPVILGQTPCQCGITDFFVAASHQIKTQEWFSVGIRQGVDSISFFIRDSETVGVYGFTDDSSNLYPSDVSNQPGDGQIPFEGEIFERDWCQWYPGLNDDPATALIEGSGIAHNPSSLPVDVSQDSTNAPTGAPLFAFGIDQLQVVSGGDPSQIDAPGYQPSDWYFDNYTVMGAPICWPDPVRGSGPQQIDGSDLAGLLSVWGLNSPPYDFNEDGIVDGADLAAMLSLWGSACVNGGWVPSE